MSRIVMELTSKILLLLALVTFGGCSAPAPSSDYGYGPIPDFKDAAPSNTEVASLSDFDAFQFVDLEGKPTNLQNYHGQKNVVLVITRGLTGTSDASAPNAGGICLYCATQTSRIAANYAQFQERQAEVVVVFPIMKSEQQTRVEEFDSAVKWADDGRNKAERKFPLVLDVGLQVVDRLGIRKDLSKPATYILDKAGKVRYAYVGANLADRPSVKAMLAELDQINQTSNP